MALLFQILWFISTNQCMENDASDNAKIPQRSLLDEAFKSAPFKLNQEDNASIIQTSKLFACHIINQNPVVYVVSIVEGTIKMVKCTANDDTTTAQCVEIQQEKDLQLGKWVYFASVGRKINKVDELYGVCMDANGTYTIYKLTINPTSNKYTPTVLFTHKHPVVHIGIVVKDQKQYLVSGSLYPAIKIYDFTQKNIIKTLHNRFLLGTNTDTLLYAKKNNPPWTFWGRWIESDSKESFPCTLYTNSTIIDNNKETKLSAKQENGTLINQLSIELTNYPIIGYAPSTENVHAFIDPKEDMLYTIDSNSNNINRFQLATGNINPIKLASIKKLSGNQVIDYFYTLLHKTVYGSSIAQVYDRLNDGDKRNEFLQNTWTNFFFEAKKTSDIVQVIARNLQHASSFKDAAEGRLKGIKTDTRLEEYKKKTYRLFDVAFIRLNLCYYIKDSTWLTHDNLVALEESILLKNNCTCFVLNQQLYCSVQEINDDTVSVTIYKYAKEVNFLAAQIIQDNKQKQEKQRKEAETKEQIKKAELTIVNKKRKRKEEQLAEEQRQQKENAELVKMFTDTLDAYKKLNYREQLKQYETYKKTLIEIINREQVVQKALSEALYNTWTTSKKLNDDLATMSIQDQYTLCHQALALCKDFLTEKNLYHFLHQLTYKKLFEKIQGTKVYTIQIYTQLKNDAQLWQKLWSTTDNKIETMLDKYKESYYKKIYVEQKESYTKNWSQKEESVIKTELSALQTILDTLFQEGIILLPEYNTQNKDLGTLAQNSIEEKKVQKEKEQKAREEQEQMHLRKEQEKQKAALLSQEQRQQEATSLKTKQEKALALQKKKEDRKKDFAEFKSALQNAFKNADKFLINSFEGLPDQLHHGGYIYNFVQGYFVNPIVLNVTNTENKNFKQFTQFNISLITPTLSTKKETVFNYDKKVLTLELDISIDLSTVLDFVIENGKKYFPDFAITPVDTINPTNLWDFLSDQNNIIKNIPIDPKNMVSGTSQRIEKLKNMIQKGDQTRLTWLCIAIALQTGWTKNEQTTIALEQKTKCKTLQDIKTEIIDKIEKLSIDDSGNITLLNQ